MLGNDMLDNWSTNQAVIALSSGEAEYNSLVEAGRGSLRLKALTSQFGIEFANPIEIISGASAATGLSNRGGP